MTITYQIAIGWPNIICKIGVITEALNTLKPVAYPTPICCIDNNKNTSKHNNKNAQIMPKYVNLILAPIINNIIYSIKQVIAAPIKKYILYMGIATPDSITDFVFENDV